MRFSRRGVGGVAVLLLPVLVTFSMTGCASFGALPRGHSCVVLYGSEGCAACRTFKRGLDREGVAYAFKDVEDGRVRKELFPRMERAGMDTGYFVLPVVDVNGQLACQPDLKDTLALYRSSCTIRESVAGNQSIKNRPS